MCVFGKTRALFTIRHEKGERAQTDGGGAARLIVKNQALRREIKAAGGKIAAQRPAIVFVESDALVDALCGLFAGKDDELFFRDALCGEKIAKYERIAGFQIPRIAAAGVKISAGSGGCEVGVKAQNMVSVQSDGGTQCGMCNGNGAALGESVGKIRFGPGQQFFGAKTVKGAQILAVKTVDAFLMRRGSKKGERGLCQQNGNAVLRPLPTVVLQRCVGAEREIFHGGLQPPFHKISQFMKKCAVWFL